MRRATCDILLYILTYPESFRYKNLGFGWPGKKYSHRGGGGAPNLLFLWEYANAGGENFGMKIRFCNIVIQGTQGYLFYDFAGNGS